MDLASVLADAHSPDMKIAWLVDYYQYGFRNSLPMKTIMELLHILQNHYPERLGQVVCYKPPKIFTVRQGRRHARHMVQ